MRIPNFKSDDGALLYKDTVGKLIAPEVAKLVIETSEHYIHHGATRILDVACGPGTVSLELAKRNNAVEVVGTDYSAAMVRYCTKTADELSLSNAKFFEMNANDMQWDNEFDLIVCNLAFPFFSRPTESMKGFYNAARNHGHALLSVPGSATWHEFFVIAEEIMGDAVRMAKPFLTKIGQASKLPDAMQEAGFSEIQVSSYKLPFSFETGEDVLSFFNELFALLSYAPPEIQADLASTINKRFQAGFTMHYEALVVDASK